MDEKFYSAISEIKERLSAHTVLLAEIRKDNSEINETLKIQNGSIKELKIDKVNCQNDIANIERNCAKVQDMKKEKKSDLFKTVTIIIAVVGLLFTGYKLFPNATEKQVFVVKQINDSLMVISPGVKMRSPTSFDLDTINKVYFDIRFPEHKN